MTAPLTRVAAAVIVRADGQVLLAQRPSGKVYEGFWEFPGGKLEPGESPRAALDRELLEELGLRVRRAAPWLVQRFVYPHAHVELHFFRVFAWDGEPVGHDGQAFAWQTPGRLDVAPLLPANTRVLRSLTLPPVYAITMAAAIGEAAMLARARAAFAAGLRLVQLREKAWPRERQRAFAAALRDLARPQGVRVLLNGDEADARAWGSTACTGRRRASPRRRQGPTTSSAPPPATRRPRSRGPAHWRWISRSWGPCVRRRPIPEAPAMGFDGFARAVEGTTLPVYALGGLSTADLPAAIDAGAHGIAAIRGAWPALP